MCSLVRIGGGARRYCLPHRPRHPLYLFTSVTQTIHNIHILLFPAVSLTELFWVAFTAHCYITMLYRYSHHETYSVECGCAKGLGIFLHRHLNFYFSKVTCFVKSSLRPCRHASLHKGESASRFLCHSGRVHSCKYETQGKLDKQRQGGVHPNSPQGRDRRT